MKGLKGKGVLSVGIYAEDGSRAREIRVSGSRFRVKGEGVQELTTPGLDLDVKWLKRHKRSPAKAEDRGVVVTEADSYLRPIHS